MNSVKLELKDISKYYISGRYVTAALRDVSLIFTTGEFVAITGESGSGKSTLAHVMAGIIPFESGEMCLNDQSTSRYGETDWEQYRRDNISFISQNYGVLTGNTVQDNVVSALRLAGWENKTAKQEAEKLLRKVDLWKIRRRRAARLSSGQKQRLSIARALAKSAPILIADEPTGNLDPENSLKIIRLLADAAGDHLVIMITHDFKEAEEYVTRHIGIHDGSVGYDRELRDSKREDKEKLRDGVQREENAAGKPAGGSFRLGWYIAGLQLRARPVWTGFMAAFFALTAFAVFAFLGTFIASLDDTSTRIYDNEAFYNGDDTRLVVVKRDGTAFSQEDYDRLLTVAWAESLERWDLALDVNYYYRPGIDYEYRYSMVMPDMTSQITYESNVLFTSHTSFARTVPLMKDGAEFLKVGSLPRHMNEVVAVGDEELIGTVIPVYFWDRKNWGSDSYIYQEMTVVGVTDYGFGLYFDQRAGRMLSQAVYCDTAYPVYGVGTELEGNQITITETLEKRLIADSGEVMETFNLPDMNRQEETVELQYAGTNSSQYPNYMELSEEMFDRLALEAPCAQVSLFLRDYSYTDRAIKAITDMGYEAVSPYRVSSVKINRVLANQRLTTLVMCMIGLVMVIAAQIVVLSAMFGLEMKSYAQMSDLGLSCRGGQYSILWQVLLLTVVGQALGAGAVLICVRMGVQRLYAVAKYLTVFHAASLSGVHLAAALLVILAVCVKLRRQVFPFTRTDDDVDLSELDEEVIQ